MNLPNDLPPLEVIVGIAAAFVAIMLVLSRLGGWHSLAELYPARQPFLGRTYAFQSVQLAGWIGYNGCVTAGADPYHLYLALWPIVAFGHPPLAIPWSDVTTAYERKWMTSIVVLRFARDPAVRLRMSLTLARRLAAGAREAFTIEPGSRDHDGTDRT
jgi:hypothetical protein